MHHSLMLVAISCTNKLALYQLYKSPQISIEDNELSLA